MIHLRHPPDISNALEQDFPLKFGVPGGMAIYRKSLAFGFFYRFWHDSAAKLRGESTEEDDDLVNEIVRDISKGKRDHDAAVKYEQKVLGKAVEHVAAYLASTVVGAIPPYARLTDSTVLFASSETRSAAVTIAISSSLRLACLYARIYSPVSFAAGMRWRRPVTIWRGAGIVECTAG